MHKNNFLKFVCMIAFACAVTLFGSPGVNPFLASAYGQCTEDDTGALDIAGSSGSQGGTVDITVRIQNAPNVVDALGFDVTYDPAILQYTGFVEGDCVTGFDFFSANEPSAGTIIVGGFTTVNAIQAGATCNVVVLQFTVLTCADTSVGLQSLVDDVASWSNSGGCFNCATPTSTTTTTSVVPTTTVPTTTVPTTTVPTTTVPTTTVPTTTTTTVSEEINVNVDIKPGSCPNNVNVFSSANVAIAILGTSSFDVRKIDPQSIRINGRKLEPRGIEYQDAATPFTGEPCGCNKSRSDGYTDLQLRYRANQLSFILQLWRSVKKEVTVTMSGRLKPEYGGTPFEGRDCIVVPKWF